jgi:coupling of ubiquitin conjugation to ER degradation protein 1
MIEVVETVAPELTREQIEYDLQRTGSVELTVNNYMENGGLPFPPNSTRNTTIPAHNNSSNSRTATSTSTNNTSSTSNSTSNTTSNSQSSTPKPPQIDFSSVNLLQKYNIDASNPVLSENDLLSRKQKMILEARDRLKLQLEKST